MGKFAKLYDIGDEQLLVILRSNDDDEPQVACITEIDGIEMTIAPTFTPKNHTQELIDEAWVSADKYFISFDQEKAETIRTGMVEQYEKLNR